MTMLFESHYRFLRIHPVRYLDNRKCSCSYCEGKHKLHFGLNLPEDRSWNSWRVIKIGKFYIRWTLKLLKHSALQKS